MQQPSERKASNFPISPFFNAINPFYHDDKIHWNPFLNPMDASSSLGITIIGIFGAAIGENPIFSVDPEHMQKRVGFFDYLTVFSFLAVNGWLTKFLNYVVTPIRHAMHRIINDKKRPFWLKLIAFIVKSLLFYVFISTFLAKVALSIPRLVIGCLLGMLLMPLVVINHVASAQKPSEKPQEIPPSNSRPLTPPASSTRSSFFLNSQTSEVIPDQEISPSA